jgi:aldehyde:ferredoxin oxidoreductase
MVSGYTGKLGFVDLSSGEIHQERIDDSLAHEFIGGYGLGVRILFERQQKGVDPLGPENTLGFTTGPLTGTGVPTGSRYMVVCKSPLTVGWGDANAGGYFGSELKAAGWDAIFVTGISSSHVYLMVSENRIEIKDASHLWGKDTIDTEDTIRSDAADPKIRIASIGPASEGLSLISGIISDKGRAAGRSGVGAVMGSKRLKAVAVRGNQKVPVADKAAIDRLRKDFVKDLRDSPGFHKGLMEHGTCSGTSLLLDIGATPVKNWLLAGGESFKGHESVTDADTIIAYQKKKYACANCPVACGGIFSVSDGRYPLAETKKPEYETLASFGSMCLNKDLYSIFKLNDMCNRSGLDTISAGSVLAFAMECYEKGIISKADTDGIELTWGNGDAMITMLDKIIRREGLGDVLADGVRIAAKKMGAEAEACAIHVGGQEPGMHSPLLLPGRATGYLCDPTPGRHTATPMARIDVSPADVAPYPEMQFRDLEQYDYKSKGAPSATVSCYSQVGNCAGVCNFALVFFGNYPFIDFFNAVTGWGMSMEEAMETGARVQTLRQCFNLREGLGSSEIKLHTRMKGSPPMDSGPVAGVTIDEQSLAREYRKAMGWDPESGRPMDDTLRRLGLEGLVKRLA